MKRFVLPTTALAVALMVPHDPIAAAKPGNVVDLGTLGGGFSDAFGINNDPSSVQVVGRSTRADGFTHAFFWTAPGPMVDLGTFGGGNSFAWDINDHGQIAGSSEDSARQQWAAVWDVRAAHGPLRTSAPSQARAAPMPRGSTTGPPAIRPQSPSWVAASSARVRRHAAVWTGSAGGWVVQTLGTLQGDAFSTAHDVNDAGTIVGVSGRQNGPSSAFLWTAAAGMSRLPSLGGLTTYALAISNGGDVAGLSTDASGTRHAVRWRFSSGWVIEDLGTLGGCCSEGYGINMFGDVVGVSNLGAPGKRSGTQRAFLARPAAAMTDFGGLKGQSAARDLNDFGVVVGGSGSGQLHAVLWRLP